MAEDLDGALEYIQGELAEPGEHAYFRRAICDFLEDINDERFAFSDATAEFASVAEQTEYVPGEDDVPGNIRRIHRLRYRESGRWIPMHNVTIGEIRELESTITGTSQRPTHFAWWTNKILMWPPPPAGITFEIDYVIDATLDAATGLPFSDDPDAILVEEVEADPEADPPIEAVEEVLIGAFSNEFFTCAARPLLSSYVLIRWGRGRGRDPGLADSQTIVYNKTLAALRKEQALKVIGDATVPCSWD